MKAVKSKHDADGKTRSGVVKEYFKDGALSCVGRFRNGEKVGEWKYYLWNGVLRAIGTTSRQVVGMVLVEAATMVGVALVLAIPLGGLLSVFVVRNASSSLGFTINYQYPWGWLPIVAIMAAGVGLLAAIAPARRAGRLQVVNALALE